MKEKAVSHMERQGDTGGVRCHSCIHFYITHDRSFPYGCRAIGFKSRVIPSREVLSSSGMECQMFSRKEGGSS
jgi:hypothetical protein